jgi:hypothetical protein
MKSVAEERATQRIPQSTWLDDAGSDVQELPGRSVESLDLADSLGKAMKYRPGRLPLLSRAGSHLAWIPATARFDAGAFGSCGRYLSVEPAMRDLVDARAPWPIRMPLPDSNQDQSRLRGLFIGSKNRAPLTGRAWDVELDAASETGPVVSFFFAA